MSDRLDEAAARARAQENANRYCNHHDRSTEILDSQLIEGDSGQSESLDLIFRCGAVEEASRR